MRKLLYIALVEYEHQGGVSTKMHGQVKGLEELGYDVSCIAYGEDGTYLYQGTKKTLLSKNGMRHRRNVLLKSVKENLKTDRYDVCYIRYTDIDWEMKDVLRSLKRKNVLVYVEIATYPLPKPSGIAQHLLRWNSILFSRNIHEYIHRVLYIGSNLPENRIMGCEAAQIVNGCDITAYPVKEEKKVNGEITLIAVAQMFRLHGYERLLEGLARYYAGKEEILVKLHMVGDGPELNFYKKLCADYNLDAYVTFYGMKTGRELDELFNNSDIGIGALGVYKENYHLGSNLKIKEYLARGIPFVYACEEEGLDSKLPYVWKIENSAAAVDIKEIIQFYQTLQGKDYRAEMRQYVKEHYSWRDIYSKAGLE